jgi:hypothetical protein
VRAYARGVRLGDIDDVDRYLGKVVSDLGIDACEREDAIAIGREELVKMERLGGSLRRTAAGMIEKRIIDGMRKEHWRQRERVRSLDELEAEPESEDERWYQAAATYGPEWVDQIESADALVAFENAADFGDPRLIGRLINGTPSHRPLPPMRAGELERLQREEQRDLGRIEPPFKNFGGL